MKIHIKRYNNKKKKKLKNLEQIPPHKNTLSKIEIMMLILTTEDELQRGKQKLQKECKQEIMKKKSQREGGSEPSSLGSPQSIDDEL